MPLPRSSVLVAVAAALLVAIAVALSLRARPVEMVHIELDILPRHATVRLAGQPVPGRTLTLPRSKEPLRLEVSAEGLPAKTIDVIPDRDNKGYHVDLGSHD